MIMVGSLSLFDQSKITIFNNNENEKKTFKKWKQPKRNGLNKWYTFIGNHNQHLNGYYFIKWFN